MDKREQGRANKRAAILAALANGAVADIHKLSLVVGLDRVNTRKHLRPLLGGAAGGGEVRVVRWRDPDAACTGRETYPRPYFGLGSEPDEPKPAALTRQELSAQRRKRLRKDKAEWEIGLARRRARNQGPKRDPLVAALVGPAA